MSEKLSPRVGAVGEATAEEATRAGFEVAHIASRPLGVALVEELRDELAKKRVLLPRSDRANPDVIAALEKAEAVPTEVVAYRTVMEGAQDADIVAKVMRADAVLFFSPSAVEGFDSVCGARKLVEFSLMGVVLASGPVTLAALRERGIASAEAAKEPSVARIIDALANSFLAQVTRASNRAN
jgi:uroporphyrinogen-III synthase